MHRASAERKAEKIAVLVAFACVLQIAESMIPHPIPGLRLGLPNMLTLTALILLGFGPAMEVAVLRTLLSSFIMGTFMSPSFLLSFSGAVISTLVMGLFYRLSGSHHFFRLSVIGISIIGAFTHNLVQLSLAYLLLVKHTGIFVFFPWLSIGAVATGWVVGTATGGVCRRLTRPDETYIVLPESASTTPASFQQHYEKGTSILHRMSPAIKLICSFLLAAIVLLMEQWYFFSGLFLLLLILSIFSGIPPVKVLSGIRRYILLIATAFMLPVFFGRGAHALVDFGVIRVTTEGLRQGGLFAFRIFLLIFTSAILLRTTSPKELSQGLSRIIRPFEYLGLPAKRTVDILSLAWEALPRVWTTTRKAVSETNFSRAGNFKKLIPLLSDLIAAVYIRAGSENKPLKGGK